MTPISLLSDNLSQRSSRFPDCVIEWAVGSDQRHLEKYLLKA
jgi:hypothetical protein